MCNWNLCGLCFLSIFKWRVSPKTLVMGCQLTKGLHCPGFQCEAFFYPAKNQMLGQYWKRVICCMAEEKGQIRFSVCTVKVEAAQPRSVPPCGRVEQPWCISAYDKSAGCPQTHHARQLSARRSSWRKTSAWPSWSTWMIVNVSKLATNESEECLSSNN